MCGFAGIEGSVSIEGITGIEGVASTEGAAGIAGSEGAAGFVRTEGAAGAGFFPCTCAWAFFFAAGPCFPVRTCFAALFCGFAFVGAVTTSAGASASIVGAAVSPSTVTACAGPLSGVALQEAEESVGRPVVMRSVQPWPQAWLRASWMEVENRAWAKCATKALGA